MRPGDRIRNRVVVLVLALALPATAWSSGAAHRHDGFFLRLSAGLGAANSDSEDDLGDNLELSGLSGDVNFAIGGMVAPNLALHGTLWGWSIGDPDVELNNQDLGDLNGDLTMSALGIGITYYFMPTNLYLSGSFGLGQLNLEVNGEDADTDWGAVIDATIGKEWWVSANWGLGLAGAIGIHSIPDGEFDDNWDGVSLGLRFSATFN